MNVKLENSSTRLKATHKGIWDTGHKECHNNLWSAHAHHRPKEVESPWKNLGYPGLEYFSCSNYGYGCFGIL